MLVGVVFGGLNLQKKQSVACAKDVPQVAG
jgi:hypothetical protein